MFECAVQNDDGIFIGRINSQVIYKFWLHWREQLMSKNLEQSRIAYAAREGALHQSNSVDMSFVNDFSVFSCLIVSLDKCDFIELKSNLKDEDVDEDEA